MGQCCICSMLNGNQRFNECQHTLEPEHIAALHMRGQPKVHNSSHPLVWLNSRLLGSRCVFTARWITLWFAWKRPETAPQVWVYTGWTLRVGKQSEKRRKRSVHGLPTQWAWMNVSLFFSFWKVINIRKSVIFVKPYSDGISLTSRDGE